MIDSTIHARTDDEASRRWIGVLKLAHATSMGFALFLAQLDLPRPRTHAAAESTVQFPLIPSVRDATLRTLVRIATESCRADPPATELGGTP